MGDVFIAMTRLRWLPFVSGGSHDQIAPADQVVRRGGEGEDPIDEAAAAVAQFAEQPDGFHPPEGLLDFLSAPFTEGVARVSCGPTINGTRPIASGLCDMWGNA